MPTENRSSNTEQMVNVPLDLVDLALTLLPIDSAARFELLELRAQPAAQHQADGYSAGDMADQGAKAFRDGQRSLVLPDRELYTKYLPSAIPKNAAEVNSYKDGWNACLEEVSRLNAAAITPE